MLKNNDIFINYFTKLQQQELISKDRNTLFYEYAIKKHMYTYYTK